MQYYDIKEIKYTYKLAGTCSTSYRGNVSSHRPKSEYEAKQQAEEWIKKKHPGCTILKLEVIFK